MHNVVLESPPNIRAAYHPYPNTPPHPTSCMHLVAHNHACPFLFSEFRISRPKIEGNACILLRFPYPILSSGVVLVTPFLQPPSILTPHKPLFDFYHNQLQHLFPLSFLLNLPGHPHIPSQDGVKPIKQASQMPMFNISKRIQRTHQQSEGPYLKETQLECKPETCTVKRDPLTFI